MYNKGQAVAVGGFAFFVFIILIASVAYLLLNDSPPPPLTGNSIQDSSPNLVILNKEDCLNQKDQLFGFTVDCELGIKNLENKPVELNPKFKCYKLSSQSSSKIINAGVDAIPSGKIVFFDVSFDNDGREWSCEIVDFGVKNYN